MKTSVLEHEEQQAIAQLQLFARGVVEGLTGGRHRSRLKGSSVEFKEHRGYTRGDEIKSIDWKLYGKTDRLFIRQFEDETNLPAWLLLDQSGSMQYAGRRAQHISKHQYAVRLAACLSMLLIRQQDSVGLATFDTQLQTCTTPRGRSSHLNLLFQNLIHSKPGGETSLATCLKQIAPLLKQKGLVVLLSDCFDDCQTLLNSLKLIRHAGHEILVFQLLDRDEIDFPFRRRSEFRSLESGIRYLADPARLRTSYQRKLNEFLQQMNEQTAQLGIDYRLCTTDQPCGQALATMLAERSGIVARRGRNKNLSGKATSVGRPGSLRIPNTRHSTQRRRKDG